MNRALWALFRVLCVLARAVMTAHPEVAAEIEAAISEAKEAISATEGR